MWIIKVMLVLFPRIIFNLLNKSILKKIIIILSILFLVQIVSAQKEDFKKINYKKIRREIKDQRSEFYYPKLMVKFQKGDTMNLEEERHAYYGFIFQDAYTPYVISSYRDSITGVFKSRMLFAEDYRKIIQFSDSIMKKNPFNLRVLSYKMFAYENLERPEDFNICRSQARSIINAILSSGNGLKKETAIYVINPSHEYDILGVLGFEFGGKQSLTGHYDYLKLAKNERNIEGLYFDISPSLEAMERMLK